MDNMRLLCSAHQGSDGGHEKQPLGNEGTVSECWIDRVLNLKNEADRNYFLKKLETRQNLPTSIQQIEHAITFLQDRFDDEWLTLYPFYSSAFASVKVAAKGHHTVDFFSTLLPLGLALLVLRDSEGFDKLIWKLSLRSYDRLSVILEALSVARYKIAGYDVELVPSTQKGRSCDFKVRFKDEWIYFECKKENPIESKYFKRAQRYADELTDLVLPKIENRFPPTHRIEIVLHRRPQRNLLAELGALISNCVDAGQFGEWKKIGDVEFAVKPRELPITPPFGPCVALGRGKVDTTPKPITRTMNIVVFYDPYGSKELQKARRLIREARDQLPRDSKSIVILESLHSRRLVKIAEEKLKQTRYENLVAVVVTGNGAGLALNQQHQDFPVDFLKIAVLPGPI